MSGSLSPVGPGMGSAYSLDAQPLQIDPVTGVPIAPQVPPQAAPDLPQWAGGQTPSPAPQAPPQAPLQMSLPPVSLPFSGPTTTPSDLGATPSAAPGDTIAVAKSGALQPMQGVSWPPNPAAGAQPTPPTPSGAQTAPATVSPDAAPAPQSAPPGQRDYAALLPGMFQAESGNRDVKNPVSSASGPGQMLDSTFEQFVKSPANTQGWTMADKGKTAAQMDAGAYILKQNEAQFQKLVGRPPTDPELQATWFFGASGAAKLVNNPDAPISGLLSADAIAKNPTLLRPDMTGAQALAASAAHFGGGKGVVAPGVPGGPPQPGGQQPGTPQPQQIQQPTDSYLSAMGFPMPNPHAYTGGPGDQLLAIGAGLGGASSLGRGFAAAGQNVLALGQNNRDAQMKAAQFGLENQRLQQQFGFQNAQLGLHSAALQNTVQHQGAQLDQAQQRLNTMLAPKPTGVTTKAPDGSNLQELRDPTTGALTYVPMTGTTTRQQSVDLRTSAQGGQPKLIQQAIVDNGKRADEIDADAEKSYNLLPQIQNFRAVLNSGQSGAGTTAVDQFKRYIAQKLGMNIGDTTPDSSAVAQALSSQLVNGQISSTMRGLGMRSNLEFNSFKEGMAGLDKNPAALQILMDQMEKGAQYNVGVFNAWHGKNQDEQEQIRRTPGGMSNFEAPLLQQYGVSRGVGPTGQAQPTITQGQDGAWKPTTATLPGGGQIIIQRVQ